MASGSPSRRRHSVATVAALAAPNLKSTEAELRPVNEKLGGTAYPRHRRGRRNVSSVAGTGSGSTW